MWNFTDVDERSRPTWSAAVLNDVRKYSTTADWWRPFVADFVTDLGALADRSVVDSEKGETLGRVIETGFKDGFSVAVVDETAGRCAICVPPTGYGLYPGTVMAGVQDRLQTCPIAVVRVGPFGDARVDAHLKHFAHLDPAVRKGCIDGASYDLRSVLKQLVAT